MNFCSWMAIGFMVAVVFASFFEWTLHKYFMHRPVGRFDYAFKAHALVHHQTFKADHTYHLINEKDKKTIPMAWWNGPVLIAAGITPFAIILTVIHFVAHMSWPAYWGYIAGTLVGMAAYYGTYEYIHWCMHLPKKRNIERSGIYFRLNGHHLLHHRYMHKNFNVVCPLADLCLGTLLLRAKVSFKQAQGPSVPNVQPDVKKGSYWKFWRIWRLFVPVR